MTQNTQTTAERLLAIIGMNYRIIQHGDTRIADHSKAADIAAAEIDALTAERDTLAGQLADVVFAAHMPIDYEYGLPSWINQRLYAAYIGAKQSPEVMAMIEDGRLRFPNGIDARECEATRERRQELENELESVRDDFRSLTAQLAEARAEVERLRPLAEEWEKWREFLMANESAKSSAGLLAYDWMEAAARARAAKEAA